MSTSDSQTTLTTLRPGPSTEAPQLEPTVATFRAAFRPPDVDGALAEAVRSVLRDMFGEHVARTVEYYVDPLSVANQPREAMNAYQHLLGPAVRPFQQHVVQRFCERLNLSWEQVAALPLSDLVLQARRIHLRRVMENGHAAASGPTDPVPNGHKEDSASPRES